MVRSSLIILAFPLNLQTSLESMDWPSPVKSCCHLGSVLISSFSISALGVYGFQRSSLAMAYLTVDNW